MNNNRGDKSGEKSGGKQNRVREALGRLYEEYPPYFREYLRRYEEDPTSRVFAPLAEAYRKLGRLDDAIQICREGLSHHPEFHGGRVALAKCLMEKGDNGSARVELERVIRVAPENLLAQRLMGDVAKTMGDNASALHAYKMALLLAPNDVSLAERVHELEHSTAVFMHSGGVASHNSGDSAPMQPVFPGDERSADGKSVDEVGGQNFGDDPAPMWSGRQGQEYPILGAEADLQENDMSSSSLNTSAFEDSLGSGQSISSLPIDQLIGDDDSLDSLDDEGFKIEHISAIFDEEAPQKKGITTETLGDLYFSQGQFERALRIYEKLPRTAELGRKLRDCKLRLGVDENQLHRSRQIAVLRRVLEKAQSSGGKR